MASARFNITTAQISAAGYTFVAKGRTVVFDGHSVLASGKNDEDTLLPPLSKAQKLDFVELTSQQKFTQPPPRYTEAALVRTLEKEGIGRPSTYATIISTIQKNYVVLQKRAFRPNALGIFVTDKLIKHFPKILDIKFTRHLEDELDEVESGVTDWIEVLQEFYKHFGKSLLDAADGMQSFEETDEICPVCGKPLVRRVSRAGLYLACSDYPDCKYTRNLSLTGQEISADIEGKKCPLCGKPLAVRGGPRGPFVGCAGYPECKYVAQIDDPEGGARPAEGPKEGQVPEKTCPECGKPMIRRSGKRGDFWGCTGYPECKHTESIEAESSPGKTAEEEIPEKKCPNCGKTLVLKKGRRGPFLACPGYPECKYTESIKGVGGKKGSPGKRSAPEKVGRKCPECGKDLLWRKGPRGKFIGCSGFPKCRYTENPEGDD